MWHPAYLGGHVVGEDISTPGENLRAVGHVSTPTHKALLAGITYHHDPLKNKAFFEILGAFFFQ